MLTLGERLKLLVEWSPVVALVQKFAAAPAGRDKAVAATKVLEFLATKTDIRVDDDLVRLTQNILLTPEGAALVDYLSVLIRGAMEQEDAAHRSAGV